jgi:hypothetical protein
LSKNGAISPRLGGLSLQYILFIRRIKLCCEIVHQASSPEMYFKGAAKVVCDCWHIWIEAAAPKAPI